VYQVSIERMGAEGGLRVNGETITAKASGDAINLNTHVFLGGVGPGVQMADQFGDLNGFSGCIIAPVSTPKIPLVALLIFLDKIKRRRD
jgi:hypothetical protein